MAATKTFRFQPVNHNPRRTFEIALTSDVAGYSVRVHELQYGGGRVPIYIDLAPRVEIPPMSFYRSRLHYRGLLLGEVYGELRYGNIYPINQIPQDGLGSTDAFMRANLRGWEKGFPETTDDDLQDMEDQ